MAYRDFAAKHLPRTYDPPKLEPLVGRCFRSMGHLYKVTGVVKSERGEKRYLLSYRDTDTSPWRGMGDFGSRIVEECLRTNGVPGE